MKLFNFKYIFLFYILLILGINIANYFVISYKQFGNISTDILKSSRELVYEYERGNFNFVNSYIQEYKMRYAFCVGLSDTVGNHIIGDRSCQDRQPLTSAHGDDILVLTYTPYRFIPLTKFFEIEFGIIVLINIFTSMIFSIFYLLIKQQKQKEEHIQEIKGIQRQVSHDIKSPLVALAMATENLDSDPFKQLTLIKMATQRIEDIANNLNVSDSSNSEDIQDKEIHSLPGLIDEIVSEKRSMYLKHPNLSIQTFYKTNNYNSFVEVSRAEFHRVISNLINNSAESLEFVGEIKIDVITNGSTYIHIKDNGTGISPYILERVFEPGFTTKTKGKGLGLYHARKRIKEFNGDIQIQSSSDGTIVSIKLPQSMKPEWYFEAESLERFKKIVVVDDNRSVHEAVKNKITTKEFENYYSIEKFLTHTPSGDSLYFVDYEFRGERINGLQAIEKLNIPNPVLISSHYQDPEIKAYCLKNSIKIIPKSLISHLPTT